MKGWPPTPQLDRLIVVGGSSSRIGEFVMEHLAGQGIVPARWGWEQLPCPERWRKDEQGTLVRMSWFSSRHPEAPIDVWDCPCGVLVVPLQGRPPNPYPHARWILTQVPLTDGWIREQLARFFGLDEQIIEQERLALLEHIRAQRAQEAP